MFKKYLLIFFIFLNFYLFSSTLILKEKVFISENKITLQDIILNKLPDNIPNFKISDLNENQITISSSKILESLFNKSIYDVNLIGENTTIYFQQNINDKANQSKETNLYKNDPLEYLEEYFESFFDNNVFTIKIDLIKIEPEVNIKIIKNNFRWKLTKSYYSLTELKKIKKLTLVIDDKNYNAVVDVKIFSNIWNAKQSFQKNDAFIKEGFLQNYVDITKINDFDTLVFDIKKANNSTLTANISPGETLKWSYLKKNPDVVKGESINAVLKKNQIEIILPCIALNNGYENKTMKAKLINGKEISGTLRNNNGEIYIEIL